MVKIKCKICNEEKEHYGFDLCKKCYMKQYRKTHQLERKQYYHKNQLKINKRNREYNHRIGKHQSMSENKSCTRYLGCHIAEQVLSKVFKGVQIMPPNNPGYDFICGKGYKIDVKSSCRLIKNNRNDSWLFRINKNKTPNYFLCLAFDNRKNLNPEHIWLIKGLLVNEQVGISISESRLNKWSEYEQPIDKVINCCNIMRCDLK